MEKCTYSGLQFIQLRLMQPAALTNYICKSRIFMEDKTPDITAKFRLLQPLLVGFYYII